jgi:hypothetical protein
MDIAMCSKSRMPATRTQKDAKPVPGGYNYSQVESALARVFGADAAGQAGWLRGRIQHLRRLGLTPPAAGGSVVYDYEWAARWLIALRLERVGPDPAKIVAFFEANWDRKPGAKFPVKSLREVIAQARAPIGKARKAKAAYHSDDVWLIVTFDDFYEFPKIGLVQPYRKPPSNPKLDNAKGFFDYSRAEVVDVVAIPLTEALRALEAALKEAAEAKATEAV